MWFLLKIPFYKFKVLLTRFLFSFFPPPSPTLLTGSKSSLQLCDAVSQSGCQRCLLVTDAILVELGLHQALVERLTQQGVAVTIYDGVKPDPLIGQVREGLALLKQSDSEAVIALGGGSSIDAGKLIALAAANKKPLEKLVGIKKASQASLPFYVIPTTAGTGSEATVVAVISDPDTGEKKQYIDTKLVPCMAALDPELMQGMPQGVTAASGIDALTHAIEAYLSVNATDETDALALSAVELIFNSLETSYRNGQDLNARQNMALAAYYGGSAFTRTNVGYVHAIAHTLGACYHTPHGLANAITLPWVLDFYLPTCATRMADLARKAGLDTDGVNEGQLAVNFVQAVRDLNTALAIPSHLDALQPGDVMNIAKGALAEAHGWYGVPSYMGCEQCEALLRKILKD